MNCDMVGKQINTFNYVFPCRTVVKLQTLTSQLIRSVYDASNNFTFKLFLCNYTRQLRNFGHAFKESVSEKLFTLYLPLSSMNSCGGQRNVVSYDRLHAIKRIPRAKIPST